MPLVQMTDVEARRYERERRKRAAIAKAKRRILGRKPIGSRPATQFQQEEKPMQSTTVPPHAGWQLVVRRQITCAGRVYPVNSIAPATMRNVQRMIDARFLMWSPPSDDRAVPYDLPPPAAARPRPDVIEIVPDRDPVTSFKKTRAKLVEACGGDVAVAMDLIAANPEAAALQKRATHEACAREAKRRGVVSVSPDQAAL